MTYDEMVKIFEDGQKRPMSDLEDLDGFIKLANLGVILTWNDGTKVRNHDLISYAEHDQIWLAVDVNKLAEVATEDDINYLVDCGIWLDEDHGSLSMFV